MSFGASFIELKTSRMFCTNCAPPGMRILNSYVATESARADRLGSLRMPRTLRSKKERSRFAVERKKLDAKPLDVMPYGLKRGWPSLRIEKRLSAVQLIVIRGKSGPLRNTSVGLS